MVLHAALATRVRAAAGVELVPARHRTAADALEQLRAADDAAVDAGLAALFPADIRAARWNRDLAQKGLTPAGQEFLKEALTAMGCADRVGEIRTVPDLIDFDEGRIE